MHKPLSHPCVHGTHCARARAPHIVHAGDRPNTGKKGQCLLFNRKSGCKNNKNKCPYGKHVCTVCGATDHGASWHTPETPTVSSAKKRVRVELDTQELTPQEKAANLRAGRSDK